MYTKSFGMGEIMEQSFHRNAGENWNYERVFTENRETGRQQRRRQQQQKKQQRRRQQQQSSGKINKMGE